LKHYQSVGLSGIRIAERPIRDIYRITEDKLNQAFGKLKDKSATGSD
jgi:hypothetical protein